MGAQDIIATPPSPGEFWKTRGTLYVPTSIPDPVAPQLSRQQRRAFERRVKKDIEKQMKRNPKMFRIS
jgi:hypothetical protein